MIQMNHLRITPGGVIFAAHINLGTTRRQFMASRKMRIRRGRKDLPSPTLTRRKAEAAQRLSDYIEDERLRLMRAISLLDTVRIAMEAMESDRVFARGEPLLSDVLPIARDAVNETINRLDSLALRPLIDG
jgi:hypothetical protein